MTVRRQSELSRQRAEIRRLKKRIERLNVRLKAVDRDTTTRKGKIVAQMIESVDHQVVSAEKRLDQAYSLRALETDVKRVICHHGTTLVSALQVQEACHGRDRSPTPFKVSYNEWDWLGHGVYFWQEAEYRAAERATWWYKVLRQQKPYLPDLLGTDGTEGISESEKAVFATRALEKYPPPAGYHSHFAVIEVPVFISKAKTIDLLDIKWTERHAKFASEFEEHVATSHEPNKTLASSNFKVTARSQKLPEDSQWDVVIRRRVEKMADGPICTRNCELLNLFIDSQETKKQCVRAAFREGSPVIPGVNIHKRDHVQVNVLDQSIIDFDNLKVIDIADIEADGR